MDNIDPDSMSGLLDILDLKKTLVIVITKSGDTAETMSQFLVFERQIRTRIRRFLQAKYCSYN